ncbi:hypothetical protein D3C76_1481610 [compost metagenome]
MRVMWVIHAALQHVQPFEDQDIRLGYCFIAIRNAIVDEMGIDRCGHVRRARFQIRYEFHQTVHVIRKREAFLLH